MTISINNPIEATQIFTVILTVALLLSLRRNTRSQEPFPLSVTYELKGWAILAIIFAHIGYSLSSNDTFLFPLSIMAGVGVDLFLFLSGYGLVVSGLKRNLSIKEFYRNRLMKLFVPFWISIMVFFLLDFLLLDKTYSWGYVVSSFAGIFLSADLYRDLNSPLWYFTFILAYYLIFPLVFSKKRPWLGACVIYVVSYLVLRHNPVILNKVIDFYKLHTLAFPLGMVAGGIFFNLDENWIGALWRKLRAFSQGAVDALGARVWPQMEADKTGRAWVQLLRLAGHCAVLLLLLVVIIYTAYNSGMDKGTMTRQLISLVTMTAIVAVFLLKKTEIRLLQWFGVYSYEIYLFHWPILSRYDVFFRSASGWFAVTAYLGLFLLFGWLLQRLDKRLLERKWRYSRL
jgi:peptidoglycan/LPS O-acetylase OafA/YrhL